MPLRLIISIKGLFFALLCVGLSSCGSQNSANIGAGGCGGDTKNSGIILCIDSIAPTYNGNPTNNVDVQQGVGAPDCPAGTTEGFRDHSASITLSATLAQGATQPPSGGTIVITHYTIDYSINTGYTGPVIPQETINQTVTVQTSGTTTADFNLMNTAQKDAYLTAMGVLNPPPNEYTVTYTFYGKDQANRDVSARGFALVILANYLNGCS